MMDVLDLRLGMRWRAGTLDLSGLFSLRAQSKVEGLTYGGGGISSSGAAPSVLSSLFVQSTLYTANPTAAPVKMPSTADIDRVAHQARFHNSP